MLELNENGKVQCPNCFYSCSFPSLFINEGNSMIADLKKQINVPCGLKYTVSNLYYGIWCWFYPRVGGIFFSVWDWY